jgi:hypothetical protein
MISKLPVVASQKCSEALRSKAASLFKCQDGLARSCATAHSNSAVGAQEVEYPHLIFGENQPTSFLIGQL